MIDRTPPAIAAFLAREYQAARAAEDQAQIDQSWHHLERAHIVAQNWLKAHSYSHWRMLALAYRQRDWREVSGQIVRLALAPLGNLIGGLPVGNSGRSNVSAFARMGIPSDLRAILQSTQ
jgi:hypothetical protein